MRERRVGRASRIIAPWHAPAGCHRDSRRDAGAAWVYGYLWHQFCWDALRIVHISEWTIVTFISLPSRVQN
jgi:hypothetical protein